MRKALMAGILLAGVFCYGLSGAGQTKVIVHAKSKDAKFVGTSMGGAHVVISDAETGKVYAEGLTAGATGDTKKIMLTPVRRGERITDSTTAKFEAVIDIDEPRLVDVEVTGPMSAKPDVIKSSTQVWLIPGRDITGDGIMVELPGYFVHAQSVAEAELAGGKAVIPVKARVTMI